MTAYGITSGDSFMPFAPIADEPDEPEVKRLLAELSYCQHGAWLDEGFNATGPFLFYAGGSTFTQVVTHSGQVHVRSAKLSVSKRVEVLYTHIGLDESLNPFYPSPELARLQRQVRQQLEKVHGRSKAMVNRDLYKIYGCHTGRINGRVG